MSNLWFGGLVSKYPYDYLLFSQEYDFQQFKKEQTREQIKNFQKQICNYMVKYLLIFGLIFFIGCSDTQEVKRPLKSIYVPPSINFMGQFRKGYVRKSLSTNPNAIRNQSKSKYYYKTKGKYRRKKKLNTFSKTDKGGQIIHF